MSNHLEQFIKDHRDEFDSEEPAKKIWDQIPAPALPVKEQGAKVIRIQVMRWSVAAAMLLLVAGGFWMFNRGGKQPIATTQPAVETPVAKTETKPVDTANHQQSIAAVPVDTTSTAKNQPIIDHASPLIQPTEEDDRAEEMKHIAGLVEIKHRQLKKIEKDEPLLYKQFAGDVNKLDSVYNTLKKQLPKNPNREQLLEAMIQNLQLQMGLLNHQLDIIKQINHSKKSAYEKAYKSV